MKFNTLLAALLFFVAVISIASCKKDDQREIDQKLIEDFINEHNLDADSTSSGLYYVI